MSAGSKIGFIATAAAVAGLACKAFKDHKNQQEIEADNRNGYGIEHVDAAPARNPALEVSGYQ